MTTTQTETLYGIATRAAFYLVVKYLPAPWRVGHLRLFLNGRLGLWDGWAGLPESDKAVIARFLGLRPAELATSTVLGEQAAEVLAAADTFVAASDAPDPTAFDPSSQADRVGLWRTDFRELTGRDPLPRINELLDKLAARRQTPLPCTPKPTAGYWRLQAGEHRFDVPVAHVPSDAPPAPAIATCNDATPIHLDLEELDRLAERLEAADPALDYYKKHLGTLRHELRDGASHRPAAHLALDPGPLQLLVAPTGRGKSLFARLLAIQSAAEGRPVAIAVPGRVETVKECRALEACAETLGLHLRIAPLNAVRSQHAQIAEILTHEDTDTGRWALRRLGYFCALSAYADPPAQFPVGEEPCLRLRELGDRADRRADRACPFVADCPRHDAFRRALEADIIVINHRALFLGRAPIPVSIDGQRRHKLSLLELVLRRCPLLLVDEIDGFQAEVIRHSTSALNLSAGTARATAAAALLRELETMLLGLPNTGYVEGTNRLLHRIGHVADRLTQELNADSLSWPPGDHFHRHAANDARLARELFGDAASPEAIQALFAGATLPEPAGERLRVLLHDWPGLGIDATDTGRYRGQLWEALAALPRLAGADAKRLRRCADGLMLRAFLGQLSWALSSLLPKLEPLEQHELEQAGRLRERLLGFLPWMPSPLGPLGQRQLGFGLRTDTSGPRSVKLVEAMAFSGDPHGYVAGLGEETARALVGTPRCVLGLSATGRFPGANQYDVRGRILAYQTDDRNDIRLLPCTLAAPDGKGNLRISGISDPDKRLRATKQLANLLWSGVLAEHIEQLAAGSETHKRARVLITTGSYREAKAAAEGIAEAMRDHAEAQRRLRVVIKEDDDYDRIPTLTRRTLARFAETGADVLLAPLAVVARGHNILQPGTDRSALHSIFVLVRPVPHIADPAELLAFISYRCLRAPDPDLDINDALHREKRHAEALLRRWQRAVGPFSRLPRQILHSVFSSVLVELTQLAGRARRGNTPTQVYLVDGAFEHAEVGWGRLVENSLRFWRQAGALDDMRRLHGALISALDEFASTRDVP